MCEKGIAEKLPENCPVSIVLEEGTCELHRRVLLDDLEEESYRKRFISEMNLDVGNSRLEDEWNCVVKKVEEMTMSEIRAFSGY